MLIIKFKQDFASFKIPVINIAVNNRLTIKARPLNKLWSAYAIKAVLLRLSLRAADIFTLSLLLNMDTKLPYIQRGISRLL
jgi:hypothetical protein